MARPLSGLPQKKLAVLRMAPDEFAKVRELAAGIDASVSEVMRVLIVGGLGIAAVVGIKALIDAEHDRHVAALAEARKSAGPQSKRSGPRSGSIGEADDEARERMAAAKRPNAANAERGESRSSKTTKGIAA